jgi:preprotein translocase subunit SecG
MMDYIIIIVNFFLKTCYCESFFTLFITNLVSGHDLPFFCFNSVRTDLSGTSDSTPSVTSDGTPDDFDGGAGLIIIFVLLIILLPFFQEEEEKEGDKDKTKDSPASETAESSTNIEPSDAVKSVSESLIYADFNNLWFAFSLGEYLLVTALMTALMLGIVRTLSPSSNSNDDDDKKRKEKEKEEQKRKEIKRKS